MPVYPITAIPANVQRILSSVGYNKKDIQVSAVEKVCIQFAGGNGIRGFAVAGNLETGEHRVMRGSWGGANPFESSKGNAVDRDSGDHTIPVNGFVITGWEGGGKPVHAEIHIQPANLPKQLTDGGAGLSADEKQILAITVGYKAFARREYWAQIPGWEALIEKLVSGGFLTRNKAGAISITTAGKNACEGVRHKERRY